MVLFVALMVVGRLLVHWLMVVVVHWCSPGCEVRRVELERIRPVEVVVVVDVVRVVVMMMWMDLVPVVGVVDGRRSMSAPLSRLKISTGTLGLVLSTWTLGRRRSRTNNSSLILGHSTLILRYSRSLCWPFSLEDICLGCILRVERCCYTTDEIW